MQYSAPSSAGETLTFPLANLPHAFASIPDPRSAQGRRYSLAALLSLTVAAVLTNNHSVLAIAEWGARQSRAIRRALGFEHETMPHQTTLQRALARLNPTDVAQALRRAFDPLRPGEIRPRGSHGVALDGKAQRGRLRHAAAPVHPIHAVSAFCHDLGGVVAQLVVDAREHEAELTVAPQAIAQIDWQGRVLTGDALYCQRAICTQVVEAGGDYLFIIKDNQPSLLDDIKQVFAPLSDEAQARTGVHTMHALGIDTYRTVEKGHGRIEERMLGISSELEGYHDWPDTVGEIGSGCQGRKAGGAGLSTRHLLEPLKQAVDVHRCDSRDLLQMGLGQTMIARVAEVESSHSLGNRAFDPRSSLVHLLAFCTALSRQGLLQRFIFFPWLQLEPTRLLFGLGA